MDGSSKKRSNILQNFRQINKSVNNAYLRIKEAKKEGIDDKSVERTAEKMGKLMSTILKARPQSVSPSFSLHNSALHTRAPLTTEHPNSNSIRE